MGIILSSSIFPILGGFLLLGNYSYSERLVVKISLYLLPSVNGERMESIKIMCLYCGSVEQVRKSSDRNHSEHQRIWRSFEEQWQLKFRKAEVILLTGHPPMFIGELEIFQDILNMDGKDGVFYTRYE